MKKLNITGSEKQREMEEFSRKVWECRDAQRKAFLDAVDKLMIQKKTMNTVT